MYHYVVTSRFMTFFDVMSSRGDTTGEGPWWHVYTAERCGCILTVSHICRVGFLLPSLQFSSSWVSYRRSSLTVFSQQPASDADSVCPACEMLL